MPVSPPMTPRARRARRSLAALCGAAIASAVLPLAVSDPASAQTIETATWTEATPAHSPPARAYFASSYDARLGQMVVFGGVGDGGNRNDTWVFDGLDWTQKNAFAGAPPARRYTAMAYDASLGETVLFGGRGSSGVDINDTWVWNGAYWTQQTAASGAFAPGARHGHSMVYDAARAQVVLFGGYDSNGAYRDDTWVWDTLTNHWIEKSPTTSPPSARYLASMAYDPVRNEVVLFGGEGSGLVKRNDTWVWDGTTWTERKANGCSGCPPARIYAHMTYDATRGQMLLFGGRGGAGLLDDTWAWDGSNWVERDPSNFPSAREGGQMEFHAATGRSVLFGGSDGSSYVNDTWTFGAKAEVQQPQIVWPSNDPACVTAGNVLRGYVDGAFVSLRTGPDGAGGTVVCVATDDGTRHLGGKLVLNGAPGTPVQTDAQAGACGADANNQRVQSGMLLGQPYALDVTLLPDGDPDVAWVCVQAAGTSTRLVVTTSGAGAGTRFEPDALTTPPGGYPEEAWPVTAQPSADCKAATSGTRTRLVNLRVGASDRVALYAWRESLTRAHGCFRAQSGASFAGGRFTVDAVGGIPVVTTGSDLGPCTFPVLTRNEFPSFGIHTSDPDDPVPPASACAQVTSTTVRVTVSSAGSSAVSFDQDTA